MPSLNCAWDFDLDPVPVPATVDRLKQPMRGQIVLQCHCRQAGDRLCNLFR